jgi:hypothetical protein
MDIDMATVAELEEEPQPELNSARDAIAETRTLFCFIQKC